MNGTVKAMPRRSLRWHLWLPMVVIVAAGLGVLVWRFGLRSEPSFNEYPMLAKTDEKRVKLDTEKAQAWLKKGAQPTDRVLRFLDKAGLMNREPRNNPTKALPGKKRQEREKAQAEAAAKAEAAAATPQS